MNKLLISLVFLLAIGTCLSSQAVKRRHRRHHSKPKTTAPVVPKAPVAPKSLPQAKPQATTAAPKSASAPTSGTFAPVCFNNQFFVYVEKTNKACSKALLSLNAKGQMKGDCKQTIQLPLGKAQIAYIAKITKGGKTSFKRQFLSVPTLALAQTKEKVWSQPDLVKAIQAASGCTSDVAAATKVGKVVANPVKKGGKQRLHQRRRVSRTSTKGHHDEDFQKMYGSKVISSSYSTVQQLTGTSMVLKGAVGILSYNDPGNLAYHQHLSICAVDQQNNGHYFFFEKGFDSVDIGFQYIGKSVNGCHDAALQKKLFDATCQRSNWSDKLISVFQFIGTKAASYGLGVLTLGVTKYVEWAYDIYSLPETIQKMKDVINSFVEGTESRLQQLKGVGGTDMDTILGYMLKYRQKITEVNSFSENSQHFAVGFFNSLTGSSEECKNTNWSDHWQKKSVIKINFSELRRNKHRRAARRARNLRKH